MIPIMIGISICMAVRITRARPSVHLTSHVLSACIAMVRARGIWRDPYRAGGARARSGTPPARIARGGGARRRGRLLYSAMLAAALGLLAFGAERKGQPHILFILADVRYHSSKSSCVHWR